MPITLDGSNGITTPMYNGSITANAVTPSVNMKNKIINGACVIDQRNAGASVTPAAVGNNYNLDRWSAVIGQANKISVQQNAGSVTPPAGFTNYLGVTSLASTSLGATDYYTITQNIEGYNVADLDFGKSTAKTITLSFWVRSSLTGTFGGALENNGQSRSYPFSYTISAANTWEQKSVTIAGDTSGTWNTTNSIGISVWFSLGVGSTYSGTAGSWSSNTFISATGATSVVGTNGATFYITGVQLEVGSTATSFDYRPYGTELALCQRYAYVINTTNYPTYSRLGIASAASGTNARTGFPFPVTMRTTPSVTYAGTARLESASAYNITGISASGMSAFSFGADITVASGLTANGAYSFDLGANAGLTLSAEL